MLSGNTEVRSLRLKQNVQLQTKLEMTFGHGALTTGGVMLFSVAVIPFIHVFWACAVLAWCVAVIGILGFLACLLLYGRVMQTALYRQ